MTEPTKQYPKRGVPAPTSSAPTRPARVADPSNLPPPRGQPVQSDPPDDNELPPRRKTAHEPHNVPPRRPPPEAEAEDSPPRRPGSTSARPAATPDNGLPPRRAQPVGTPGEAEAVNDPPLRRRAETSTSAPASRPSHTAAPQEEKIESGGSRTAEVTFTTGNAASEIEIILKMLEEQIVAAELSTSDLHSLASGIIIFGKFVSRLAREREDAVKRSDDQDHEDNQLQPLD